MPKSIKSSTKKVNPPVRENLLVSVLRNVILDAEAAERAAETRPTAAGRDGRAGRRSEPDKWSLVPRALKEIKEYLPAIKTISSRHARRLIQSEKVGGVRRYKGRQGYQLTKEIESAILPQLSLLS